MKITTIIYFALSLFLGVMMLLGGYKKFEKPIPPPTQIVETIEKEGAAKIKEDVRTLKVRNYIFGMKQTNYFWQLLGVCEILFGLMIMSQYMRFAGAVMLVPITLHIFLFHVFLEPDEIGELIETGLLFAANIALIGKEYPKWKHLVWFKS
jgi:uncharacterized membrane protein YphA (DoxX/SURF4 family)